MEPIFTYLKPVAETAVVGFVLLLPFLADRYLKAAQERMRKTR